MNGALSAAIRARTATQRVAATALVAILAFTAFAGTGCSSGCARPPDSRFDAIRDNTDAQALVGRTRADITAEFGDAPATSRFAGEWDTSYWMRPQGMCMDGWYLVLDFGRDGHVTHAAVWPD